MVKGKAPTLLDTATANRVIDSINGLINARIQPDGAGTVSLGTNDCVIDLSPLVKLINDQVQAQIQAALSQSASNAGGGAVAPGPGSLAGIVASLQAATMTITCNSDGTISGAINFPGL